MFRLYVIGIGYKPLSTAVKEIINVSDLIMASGRLFDIFRELDVYENVKAKVKVINNVDETIGFIKSNLQNVKSHIVLLASGDPLFYGIGRRAVREFGKDAVEIIPDISSVQLAFSKIKEPWDDAFLMSLHGGPDPNKRRWLPYDITDIPELLKAHKKIAILTDKVNNPSRIAEILSSSDVGGYTRMFVCEKLGYLDERILEGTSREIQNLSFKQPNLVILLSHTSQDEPSSYGVECFKKDDSVFGLSEEDITHTRGLITKDEVRAVSLHKLRLPPRGIFWDIGAGSGSVSLEVSRLCPEMKVYAVERDPVQTANILSNKKRFGLQNIHVIEGEAPEALKDLPAPQRVFIGGSGRSLQGIIKVIADAQAAIIVINAATIETLNNALKSLGEFGYDVDAAQVNISRMKSIGKGNFFSSLNPVFIVSGRKMT